MHAAAAVGAHLVTAAEGRSFLCARGVQIRCGIISCNKLVCVKYGWGYVGGGYLNGLKLSGVRDGALGVTPPKSQSRVQSEVRFCTNSSGECRNGRGYDGGCYLSDLKAPGECCGALELCAPLPSEKGSTGKVCTSGCCEDPPLQTLVFPTPAT